MFSHRKLEIGHRSNTYSIIFCFTSKKNIQMHSTSVPNIVYLCVWTGTAMQTIFWCVENLWPRQLFKTIAYRLDIGRNWFLMPIMNLFFTILTSQIFFHFKKTYFQMHSTSVPSVVYLCVWTGTAMKTIFLCVENLWTRQLFKTIVFF